MKKLIGFLLGLWCLGGPALPAADAYYAIPLKDLKFTGNAPPNFTERDQFAHLRPAFAGDSNPYVTLDGPGEAFLSRAESLTWFNPNSPGDVHGTLHLRRPAAKVIAGTLFWPDPKTEKLVAYAFTAPAPTPSADARLAFFRARGTACRDLCTRGVPGGAWFARETREAERELSKTPATPSRPGVARAPTREDLSDTFSLFTGGRALAENLQLDRALLLPGESSAETVPLSEVVGLTVKELDWKPLIGDAKPEIDALARCVPADQHAVFFPRFDAMETVMEAADRRGTPVLELFAPRAEDYGVKAAYQRMLCLPLTDLGKKVGRLLVKGVAMTGSDPYLRMGSDVAVLFESDSPDLLRTLLLAQRGATVAEAGATRHDLEVEGVAVSGVRTSDRAICSYLAVLGHTVAISNSPAQIRRLVEVFKGLTPALAEAPEYTFFRARYPRTDAEEDAFLVLTDAAIRRWCSPRWRIADSRRVRALSLLTEFQADHQEALAAGSAKDQVLLPADRSTLGEFAIRQGRVVSSLYGTMAFMTPIVELPLEKVAKAEAEGYARWRDTYQTYWRTFFDPIAIRFTVKPGKTGVDATIMPLILGSDYASWIHFAKNGFLPPDGGGVHDALLHLAFGLDPESEPVRRMTNIFRGATGNNSLADPLNWLGKNAAVFIDDDPLWAEAKEAPNMDAFLQKNLHRLPIGVYAAVASPMKLVLFMTALRAYIDQTAPNMTAWEACTWQEQRYVRIGWTESSRRTLPDLEQLNLFYLVSGDTFLLTPSEAVMKRFIEHRAARGAAKERGETPAPPAHPWLGSSYGLQVDERILEVLDGVFRSGFRRSRQRLSWDNLPILNVWKKLFPNEDPVEVQRRLWGSTLRCPGGGRYVWNGVYHTMESTVFGHPGNPKPGPALEELLPGLRFGSFGLTFEENGLRARGELAE